MNESWASMDDRGVDDRGPYPATPEEIEEALSAFLRARLDEEAALAQAAADSPTDEYGPAGLRWVPAMTLQIGGIWGAVGDHICRWDPGRVLAEVEAKRRVIDACSAELSDTSGAPFASFLTPPWVLETLALPYADHPDYRPEWKP